MGLGVPALAGGVVLCFGGLSPGQESVLGFLCALVPQLCASEAAWGAWAVPRAAPSR